MHAALARISVPIKVWMQGRGDPYRPGILTDIQDVSRMPVQGPSEAREPWARSRAGESSQQPGPRLVQRPTVAPRQHDKIRPPYRLPNCSPIGRANGRSTLPQIPGVGGPPREQVDDFQPAVTPGPRQVDTAAQCGVVAGCVSRRGIEHDEQDSRPSAPCPHQPIAITPAGRKPRIGVICVARSIDRRGGISVSHRPCPGKTRSVLWRSQSNGLITSAEL
jgi:hypothetical protein